MCSWKTPAGDAAMTAKPFSSACERNRDPILAVLHQHFAACRRVLEIGSGTGQHAVHFAAAMPWLTWQCSDVADNLPGIRSWLDEAGLANTPAPIELEVARGPWPVADGRAPDPPSAPAPRPRGEANSGIDAVFSANTLHIMGWAEVEAFFAGVGRVLRESGEKHPSSALRAPALRAPARARGEGSGDAGGERGGVLAVYGPFNYGGGYSSDSNRDFDGWLKARDPRSGIRDFEAVDALARGIGLRLLDDVAMPANNRCLVWRRDSAPAPRPPNR